jgi:transcriptional regulator with XRE-family HTH domain
MNTQHIMVKVRRLAADSGLTWQVIGEKMGYPVKSARQSISQFLKGTNPTIETLTRFAKAIDVDVKTLL